VAGVVAFLMFGLLNGALVGGTFGMETGSYIFGYGPESGDTVPRIMAAAGMLVGVAITGAMFVTCGLALGRLAGLVIGATGSHRREAGIHERLHTNRN